MKVSEKSQICHIKKCMTFEICILSKNLLETISSWNRLYSLKKIVSFKNEKNRNFASKSVNNKILRKNSAWDPQNSDSATRNTFKKTQGTEGTKKNTHVSPASGLK